MGVGQEVVSLLSWEIPTLDLSQPRNPFTDSGTKFSR